MTGPEHYREAERLVKPRTRYYNGGQTVATESPTPTELAMAQVHAALALVAAQAAPWVNDVDDRTGSYVHADWVEALS